MRMSLQVRTSPFGSSTSKEPKDAKLSASGLWSVRAWSPSTCASPSASSWRSALKAAATVLLAWRPALKMSDGKVPLTTPAYGWPLVITCEDSLHITLRAPWKLTAFEWRTCAFATTTSSPRSATDRVHDTASKCERRGATWRQLDSNLLRDDL